MKNTTNYSLTHATPPLDTLQKIAVLIGIIGLLIMMTAWLNLAQVAETTWLYLSLTLISIGTLVFAWRTYIPLPEGIKNNGVWHRSLTNKGTLGWIVGIGITYFYVLLYWYPTYLGLGTDGAANTGLVAFFDPLSYALKKTPASQWFVYGTLYTLAILVFGVKFILKYRHNKYQILRTISVMFFQLGFAFLLPEILQRLHYPYYDFKNMWPLNYYFFDEWSIKGFLENGHIGLLMLGSGLFLMFLGSPILTYLYGKRWYCSWVCGCGGLAETAGDPFRHLSDKSLRAWRIERWMIHGVLCFVVLMTVAVLYSFFNNNTKTGYIVTKPIYIGIVIVLAMITAVIVGVYRRSIAASYKNLPSIIWTFLVLIVSLTIGAYMTGGFWVDSAALRKWYGFFIGAAFSGVVGVGFYPLLGNRVWCRFGCPMAAILGLQQRFFSQFRITTNGGQCISCGNCSVYCEMGIDVRAYAQKGQNIVRASCVGCGICAAVCPRGVLRLENGAIDIASRTEDMKVLHITKKGVTL